MAINTRDRRASALREGLLPLPDGAVLDQGDRQQVLWQYRGIAATPPTPGSPSIDNQVRVGAVRGAYISSGPSIGGQF